MNSYVPPLPLPSDDTMELYKEINRLILEYLELNGLEDTMATLKSECMEKNIPFPVIPEENKICFSHFDKEVILKCFDEGDREGFFTYWKLFQNQIQAKSEDMLKLEVYLRVHFALWPKFHGAPEKLQTEAMNSLKTFFETNSDILSTDESILPLFALPYISDPRTHALFKDFFELKNPTWEVRLRFQLESTINKYFGLLRGKIVDHSRLATLVENSLNPSEETGEKAIQPKLVTPNYQDRFYQLVTAYRKARKLLRGTRESYGKLLKVSNELIIGLERSLGGEDITLDPIVFRCFTIFPELFSSESVTGGPDKEYFKRLASGAYFDTILDSDVSLFFIGISDMTPDALKFSKIKRVLGSEDYPIPEKLCILQALRWLLTKSTNKCRQFALEAFVGSDILGLDDEDQEYKTKLFACMNSPVPTYMKECFVRFLNALASLQLGRSYMSSSNYCVDVLIIALKNFKGQNETYICQMVIAALQKMSLRKNMRLLMIEKKVVQRLITLLKGELGLKNDVQFYGVKLDLEEGAPETQPPYNPYLMEYAWALLMNLCLHDESMAASNSISPDILSSIVKMLHSNPHKEVYPYVISTLYSLLRNPDIFAMARKMKLNETLEDVISKDKVDVNNHLSHVVSILQMKEFDRITTMGEIDYDDNDSADPEEFEPELEVPENWVGSLDEESLIGDDLLIREYLNEDKFQLIVPVPPPEGNKVAKKDNFFLRPATPSSTAKHSKNKSNEMEKNYNEDSSRNTNKRQVPSPPEDEMNRRHKIYASTPKSNNRRRDSEELSPIERQRIFNGRSTSSKKNRGNNEINSNNKYSSTNHPKLKS